VTPQQIENWSRRSLQESRADSGRATAADLFYDRASFFRGGDRAGVAIDVSARNLTEGGTPGGGGRRRVDGPLMGPGGSAASTSSDTILSRTVQGDLAKRHPRGYGVTAAHYAPSAPLMGPLKRGLGGLISAGKLEDGLD